MTNMKTVQNFEVISNKYNVVSVLNKYVLQKVTIVHLQG